MQMCPSDKDDYVSLLRPYFSQLFIFIYLFIVFEVWALGSGWSGGGPVSWAITQIRLSLLYHTVSCLIYKSVFIMHNLNDKMMYLFKEKE